MSTSSESNSTQSPSGQTQPNAPMSPLDSAKSLLSEAGSHMFSVVLLRGVLAIILGLLILFLPQVMAVAFAIYVGIWLIIDGILTITQSNAARKARLSWGWEMAAGIIYILAGIGVMISPTAFAAVGGIFVLWIMTFGMLFRGVATLVSRVFSGWSVILGIFDIIFSILLMVMLFSQPGAALAALIWVIGFYAVFIGIALVIIAFVSRSKTKKALNI